MLLCNRKLLRLSHLGHTQLRAEEEKHARVKRKKDTKRCDQQRREELGSRKRLSDIAEVDYDDVRINNSCSGMILSLPTHTCLSTSIAQEKAASRPKKKERKSYGRAEDSRKETKQEAISTVERSLEKLDKRIEVPSEPKRETKGKVKEQELNSSTTLENTSSKGKLDSSARTLPQRAWDETVDDVNFTSESKTKRDKPSYYTAPSQLSLSSGRAKSAIKRKDLKSSKATSSVRFDATADRPKLDIIMSGVHTKGSNHATTKPTESNKFPPSISSTQSSGISSSETGSRRRKKSAIGGKSKAALLAMKGFEDDGGFL